jgi:hypothetical protein
MAWLSVSTTSSTIFLMRFEDEPLARLKVLAEFGPRLGRPNVDTREGSPFPNMKELRFREEGLWRFAFAFDPLPSCLSVATKQVKTRRCFITDESR